MKTPKKIVIIILSIIITTSIAFGCVLNGDSNRPAPPPDANQPPIEQPPPDDNIFTHPDLIWQDEFHGDNLDLSNWRIQTGIGRDMGLWFWGNGERQYYRAENIRIQNGKLQIIAHNEPFRGTHTANMPFTSARIRTAGRFSVRYGRIEARIRVPLGDGFWPAFWMMPEDPTGNNGNIGHYGGWPHSGEIDIMESRGRVPNRVWSAIHFNGHGPGAQSWHRYQYRAFTLPVGQTVDQFHVYAVEWRETEIRWYVNGILAGTYDLNTVPGTPTNPNAPFDREFHILLNLAIGGYFDGNREPPQHLFNDPDNPPMMEADWVRVFRLPGTATQYTVNGVTNTV